MKEYTSDVVVCFGGNTLKADNRKEYIIKVKEYFAEEYDIWLSGEEISNIEEVTDE